MRSQRNLHVWLPALLAALGLSGGAPAQVTPATEPAQVTPATEPAQVTPGPDDGPEGPGLAETTGAAFDAVLEAARRDGASWVRQFHTRWDLVAADARGAWQALRGDPVGTLDGWLERAGLPDSQTLALPAAGVLTVLLLLLELLRGRGNVRVSIEYRSELRGTFRVRLARKPDTRHHGPHTTSPDAAERVRHENRISSRNERHLVSREADFHGVRAGLWYVTVDGFLQLPDEETVVATHLERREAHVQRGQTLRLDIDLRPQQAPVDVRVLWDRRPVTEALVAWLGQPLSLRKARGEPVRLGAPHGPVTLIVGSNDRVAEMQLEIADFQPLAVEIDLANRDGILFTGCPPAVEPYLHGDIPAAARALEREGQADVANLMLARLHEEQGHDEAAAHHYAEAGRTVEAAALYQKVGNLEASAALYQSAGENERAAELYRSAGDVTAAGEAYETARNWESAAACYREAGNVSKWCDALERNGRLLEAARVGLDNDDEGRAIRCLQGLGPNDDDYVAGANLLVEVLQRAGHLDLAVEKTEEVIRNRGADEVPLETCDRLAGLLEENEQFERAIDVLEILRRRDATWPNLAARIEELRKKHLLLQRDTQPTGSDVGGVRYEILEEIGRGGMGIVFKARDRRLDRVVALKKLPENLRNHPKAVELFLREARASARLNHPNIVTIHDTGRQGDALYITMELMEGFPLHGILKHRGSLSPRDVAKLGVQACAGLRYAHEHHVIHRDIKTGNFFFTKSRTLKIMDFGLANMAQEVRRASTVIGGTPYYMAPEQSRGSTVDHRTDLYALGVTFYELLLGKVPFPDGDVAYHHRHSPAPDPRDAKEGIPDALAELVQQLMAKDPDERPQSAAETRARLQVLLAADS